jgi:hypothetical protein
MNSGGVSFASTPGLERGEERSPEAAGVIEHHRLGVQVEPAPRQQLHHFLQGADAARQDDESVGQLEHHLLALVHGGDDHRLDAVERALPGDQEVGNDAQHRAAGFMRAAGRRPIRPTPPPP